MTPPTPLTLRAARRSLRGLPGIEPLGEWEWHEQAALFALRCRLSISTGPGKLVPAVTEWYVTAEASYPRGDIKVYPAAQGGLTVTFQHQNYNSQPREDLPWRGGDVCLKTTVRVLGRHGFDTEPAKASGPSGRLRWHVLRALDWLRAAAGGTLAGPGEPFEVPHFPGAVGNATTVVYAEGAASFAQWQGIQEQCGMVELAASRAAPSVLMATRFMSSPRRELIAVGWGRDAVKADAVERGVWIRLPGAPVMEPWQAPLTWKELCDACRRHRVNLDSLMVRVLRYVRDGGRHVLLVGFPMPDRIGGNPRQMHWQALQLPVLCQGNQDVAGFRQNREGTRYVVDRRQVLTNSSPIEWLASENWDQAQLVSRGSLPAGITDSRILLVGGGALGSAIGELLLRAGARHLTVADGELFQAGNLCRHTLTLPDLKKSKAGGLAQRLGQVSPHAAVDAIPAEFPPASEEQLAAVKGCDIIIDCTAEDEVLRELARFPWGGPRRFVSLSLGHGAKRLYCFTADGAAFPDVEFQGGNPAVAGARRRRVQRRGAAAGGRRLLAPDLSCQGRRRVADGLGRRKTTREGARQRAGRREADRVRAKVRGRGVCRRAASQGRGAPCRIGNTAPKTSASG
jgi:hypothetical protein